MDPWLIIVFLVGLLIGLVAGILIASVLVRGHYTHFLTGQSQPAPAVQYVPRRSFGDYLHDDGY